MNRISIIGSTGSIGRQTLDVIRRHSDKFQVVALASNNNKSLLQSQSQEFSVSNLGLFSKDGESCYKLASLDCIDTVVIAASGLAAFPYLIEAIKSGKRIALANKECVVAAWELLTPLIEKSGATVYPVDSEHSAVWQSLFSGRREDVKRIILTASGGPFFGKKSEDLKNVSVADALDHPTWKMGKKITVDSATMMNKGLEVIEACKLFGVTEKEVDVVVHRESIVHSLVEYNDNAVVCEMSYPTMEIPIQLALSYPERLDTGVSGLDLGQLGKLSFYPLDNETFPFVHLARKAYNDGGFYPLAYSSADEVAVDAFLNGKISFTDIYDVVENTMHKATLPKFSLENVADADKIVRKTARDVISGYDNK